LANKERELEVLRLSTIRVGLHARCTAMVNCGWSWGEMGKEGLRALEKLDNMTSVHCELRWFIRGGLVSFPVQVSPPHSPRFPPASKPLSDPGDAPSDLSSILPSHSASQIALVLPPGQSDLKSSDGGHPIPGPSQPYSLSIPPAHSISDHTIPTGTELPHHPSAQDDSSSDDNRTLEVVENDLFADLQEPTKRKTKSKRRPEVNAVMMGERSALPNGSPVTKYKETKDEGRKHRVFGTIAGLFTKNSPKKGWRSRMDRNLKGDSSDEGSVRYLGVFPSKRGVHITGSTGKRLKKRKKDRAPTLDHSSFETHGWPTTEGKGKARAASFDHHRGELSGAEDYLHPSRVITRRRSSSQPHLPLPTQATSLSRDNSLAISVASITSAPANLDRTPAPTHRRRSTSGIHTPKASSHRRAVSGTSSPVNPVNPQTNLMSIVEEAVRVNKEARISMNPNNRLESIKAPPPVSEVLKHEADVVQANTQPPSAPQPSPPKPARPKSLPPRSPEKSPVNHTSPTQHNGDVNPPATTSTPTTKPTSPLTDKPLPAKTPLKSALRNHSRTPSPNSSTLRAIVSSPPPIQRISRISETLEDDSASISSYETGHENFDSRPNSPLAPPVPPRDVVVNKGVDSDLSHGTSSTAIGSADNGVSRRKSVRMSLPPTYLKTPPARDEQEVEKPPWSLLRDNLRDETSRTLRNGRDLWEDSSDEDEEYSTARRLLSKHSGRR
jgi:hypothetical protein